MNSGMPIGRDMDGSMGQLVGAKRLKRCYFLGTAYIRGACWSG